MSRTLRQTASALLVASFLFTAAARPARAVSRFGRPGDDGPSRQAERVERSLFFSFLLHLFDLSRGTMDPNGGP